MDHRLKSLLTVAWLAMECLPTAKAAEASDGAFYGVRTPDPDDYVGHGTPPPRVRGTVYRKKDGVEKPLALFTDPNCFPTHGLVQTYDGNFYGLANLGGFGDDAILYRMVPPAKLETVAHIKIPRWAAFTSELVIGQRGDLYGITYYPGHGSLHGVFRISLGGVSTVIKTFPKKPDSGESARFGVVTGKLVVSTEFGDSVLTPNQQPPVANNDSLVLPAIHANVIANDSDPNKDPIRIVGVTDGSHGTVTFTQDGTVTYLPGPDFDSDEIQSDTFTYTISDPIEGTSTATVTVHKPSDIFLAGAGNYRGMLTSGDETKGFLNLTLTKRGAVTGAVWFDGIKTPVTGSFGSDGTFSTTISRQAPLASLTLALKLKAISNAITGAVSDGTNTYSASLSRDLNLFSLERPTQLRGNYTALIENNQTGPSLPGGTGFARMSVTATGAVAITGKLGDGTPFSASASLNSDNTVSLYAKAYSQNEGYLAGTITFKISGTSDAAGLLTWHKPEQANDVYYPAGFTTATTFRATRYIKALPGPESDGLLTLGDKPPKELRYNYREPLTLRGRVVLNDRTWVTVDPQTGFFHGTCFDEAGTRFRVEGAVYPYSTARYAAGLGFGPNETLNLSIVEHKIR